MLKKEKGKTKLLHREGFWCSEDEHALPKPIPKKSSWKGKTDFLEALDKIQALAHVDHYKGYSTCRICSCRNGSTEYTFDGWVWPVGYRHYIKEHNIRPSLAFQEMIEQRYIKK